MNEIRIKICPFVGEPGPDCFCLDMNSRNIELVVRYCSGNFETCPIYREQGQLIRRAGEADLLE
jgi:hypothetical protein